MEWNFLLNKVLLTQLPALWAQAELSSHRRRSTLMNPLKYRLIGTVALVQADPRDPQAPPGSSGHRAWKLSRIFSDSCSSHAAEEQLDALWSEDERMAVED